MTGYARMIADEVNGPIRVHLRSYLSFLVPAEGSDTHFLVLG